MSITKQQIKYIHVLLNKLDITEDEYRQILFDEFEVYSCKDLTEEQASELAHKINYTYDISYKNGYNACMNRFIDMLDLEVLFKQKYNPSNLELQMFRMLDVDKQKELLK